MLIEVNGNHVPSFCIKLQMEIDNQLEKIAGEEENKMQMAERSVHAVKNVMARLRKQVSEYSFSSTVEEIRFFKEIKPSFYSKLMYYLKVFRIESRLPTASISLKRKYLMKELRKLKHFYENNLDFYQYYRSGSTYLDEQYFLRGKQDMFLTLDPYCFNADPTFSTSHDFLVAKILSNELLQIYLNTEITNLDRKEDDSRNSNVSKSILTWTAPKAALVELLYALQSTGAFNNGTADVKQVATYFEQVFNTDLGNYYRCFQEIRIRKTSRTSFLEQLQQKVIKRMDEADENPRF